MDSVVAASRDAITYGSKSFGMAARLFDQRTRESAYMLYAWCRYCDDVIDGQVLGFRGKSAVPTQLSDESPQARLAFLRERTASAMAMAPMDDDPVFIAFQRVVTQHQIPAQYPSDLLDGFAMDVAGRRYDTLDDTLEYCYHVAGVVGVMMTIIMGAKDQPTLDRACDLGIAFQLTNISRDVVEDAGVGRIYLPRQWLAEAGVAESDVAAPASRERVAMVTQRLLAEAERYYASARVGLAHLPTRCAWAIAAALRIYRAIGLEVHRRGAHAWDTRVRVSTPHKTGLATLAGFDAATARMFGRGRVEPARVGLWTRRVV
jgi:15-cis-phytoene synthase